MTFFAFIFNMLFLKPNGYFSQPLLAYITGHFLRGEDAGVLTMEFNKEPETGQRNEVTNQKTL